MLSIKGIYRILALQITFEEPHEDERWRTRTADGKSRTSEPVHLHPYIRVLQSPIREIAHHGAGPESKRQF